MQKLRSLFLLCSLALAACSCNPLRKAAASMDGGWWSVKTDTILREREVLVYVDSSVVDTLFYWMPSESDSVLASDGRVSTTVYVDRRDTLWRWRIRTVVAPDTLSVNCTDTVFVREKPPPIFPTLPPVPDGAPGWMGTVAFILGLLGFLAIIIINLRKKQQ